MAYTRIKICGITRVEDALTAAAAGAHAIGLNFYKGPRKLDFAMATQILSALTNLPLSPNVIGLCTGSSPPDGKLPTPGAIQARLPIHRFQVYGLPDTPAWLADPAEKHLPYWIVKSLANRQGIADASSLLQALPWKPQALLFDAWVAHQEGGTGRSFDWNLLADARAAGALHGFPPIILAGGLTPENVGQAIRITRPYAVDVSSGVEIAGKPGIKDPARIWDFIHAVHAADASLI